MKIEVNLKNPSNIFSTKTTCVFQMSKYSVLSKKNTVQPQDTYYRFEKSNIATQGALSCLRSELQYIYDTSPKTLPSAYYENNDKTLKQKKNRAYTFIQSKNQDILSNGTVIDSKYVYQLKEKLAQLNSQQLHHPSAEKVNQLLN